MLRMVQNQNKRSEVCESSFSGWNIWVSPTFSLCFVSKIFTGENLTQPCYFPFPSSLEYVAVKNQWDLCSKSHKPNASTLKKNSWSEEPTINKYDQQNIFLDVCTLSHLSSNWQIKIFSKCVVAFNILLNRESGLNLIGKKRGTVWAQSSMFINKFDTENPLNPMLGLW